MFSKFDGNELVRQRQSYCGAIDSVHGIAKNSIVIYCGTSRDTMGNKGLLSY